MWSGPRNISTAMMRAFGNRPDTPVATSPSMPPTSQATGLEHPQRDEILASQPRDWRAVVARRHRAGAGRAPGLVPEAHDAPHAAGLRARLDRRRRQRLPDPRARSRARLLCGEARGGDAGGDRPAAAGGAVRPGGGPARARAAGGRRRATCWRTRAARSSALCAGCGIAFDDAMLSWPAGRRASDGVWAPSWYDSVERSTPNAASTTCPTR